MYIPSQQFVVYPVYDLLFFILLALFLCFLSTFRITTTLSLCGPLLRTFRTVGDLFVPSSHKQSASSRCPCCSWDNKWHCLIPDTHLARCSWGRATRQPSC